MSKMSDLVGDILGVWYIISMVWFLGVLLTNIISEKNHVCPVEHPMRWEYAVPSRWVACWLVERK